MKQEKIRLAQKPVGRPRTDVGTQIGMCWQAPILARIDEGRRVQPELPSRTKAICRLLELGRRAKRKAR